MSLTPNSIREVQFSKILALLTGLVLSCASLSAQVVTKLVTFHQGNGSFPAGVLVQGRNGNLYGTTALGGTNDGGTVFEMTSTGKFKTIYDFSDYIGYEPTGLLLNTDGNYYGITMLGGPSGEGTIFKISQTGYLTPLYNFHGGDGSYPNSFVAGPVADFYGTTEYAGSARTYFFRISPSGEFANVNCSIVRPLSLALGIDGNFYGTAVGSVGGGYGLIFEMKPDGSCFTLYNFNGTNGSVPDLLTMGSDGAFYGTTYLNGNPTISTLFKLTENGKFTNISSSGTQISIGASMTYGSDGNFYGPTALGGEYDAGEVFEVTPSGYFTLLGSFGQNDDGYDTELPLTQHTSGIFFGPSFKGGKQEEGDLYSLNVSLQPFVTFVRGFGKAGISAQLLGQGFTGATGVSFNGILVTSFKVLSDTFMTAVVPAGATTGPVTITTPGGVLNSNVNFQVLGRSR